MSGQAHQAAPLDLQRAHDIKNEVRTIGLEAGDRAVQISLVANWCAESRTVDHLRFGIGLTHDFQANDRMVTCLSYYLIGPLRVMKPLPENTSAGSNSVLSGGSEGKRGWLNTYTSTQQWNW